MKKIFSLLMLTVVVFCGCSNDDEPTVTVTEKVISFNGLLQSAESEYVGPKEGELPEGVYYYASEFQDPTQTATFTHYVPATGNYFGGGFTYTNKTDVTTMDYTNSSAITGKGFNGNTYLVCNADSYSRSAIIKFNNAVSLKGAYFTNSTYAYLVMRDGNDYGKKFTASDWYKIIITGQKAGTKVASLDVYLAKDGKIINEWTWQDLSSLGSVDELTFAFESTDNGQFGINTPTYFCMDALTIQL